jgi:Mrp family chromosome partitioning ATPase
MMKRREELQVVARTWRADSAVASQMVDACNLASLQMNGPTLRSLGVVSTIRGEGRSSVAIAMAVVQQRAYRRRVLLLEMDFERPSLTRRVEAEAAPGLAELIRGEASLDDVVQPLADAMSAITAGAGAGAGPRLIVDFMSSGVFSELMRQFDVVVADLPPLLGSSFAVQAAGLFERTVLVVRSGVTPVAAIREAVASMPVEPLVLLNAVESSLPAWMRRQTGT